MKPTKEQIVKLIDTISCGLTKGLGEPIPGKMCIEAAICYALGLPHSDEPDCVVGNEFKISLNDASNWPSDKARAEGLMKIGIAQVGSGCVASAKQFYDLLWLKSHQQILPTLIKQKETENEFIKLFSAVKTQEEFKELWIKFKNIEHRYYNYYYYNYYYYYYNYYNHYYYNHYYYNYYYNYSHELLLLLAKIGLETYQELKSPGCEFLYLVEEMQNEIIS